MTKSYVTQLAWIPNTYGVLKGSPQATSLMHFDNVLNLLLRIPL